MNERAWRRLLLCAAALLLWLAGGPAISQSMPPSEPNASTELPPHIRRQLDSELQREAKAKKIDTGRWDAFPMPVCDGGLCGAINRDGTFAVPLAYNGVERFSEGRALVRVRHRYSYLYGYVDDTGRVIARPQYTVADQFRHGFAQINVEGKSGLIDREGQVALWPRFGFAVPFTHDLFWVTEERKVIPGNNGTERFYFEHRPIFINGGGDTAIMAKGKWGLVDRSGSWIRQPEFLDVQILDRGDTPLMWAKTEAGWGLIRPDLSWQVEPKFEHVGILDQGLAKVRLDARWGFVDATGRIVIEPRFNTVSWFSGRYAPARIDKLMGLIDRTGQWALEPQYDAIVQGFPIPRSWWTILHDKKFGVLDDALRVIIAPQLDQPAQMCSGGRFLGVVGGKQKVFTHDGAPAEDADSCESGSPARAK